jgi:hypothetical protein
MPTRKYVTKARGSFRSEHADKPVGARCRTTPAIESLLEGEAKNLTRKAVKLALAGDTVALRLCLDRISPVRRDRPLSISLPEVTSGRGLVAALSEIVAAMSEGRITPDEAARISAVVEIQRRAVETFELESRLQALEQWMSSHEKNS